MTDPRDKALDFSFRATERMYVAQGLGEPGAAEVVWQEGRLDPTGPLDLSPAAAVLSYGLGIFEGLKIHRTDDGRLLSFRVSAHAERFQRSARILGMAPFPVAAFTAAIADLVRANAAFVPAAGSGSLYVRAMQFADEAMLGLAPCRSYRVAMYGSPVGPYFAAREGGIRLRLLNQARVAGGGTGHTPRPSATTPAAWSSAPAGRPRASTTSCTATRPPAPPSARPPAATSLFVWPTAPWPRPP